MGSPGHDGDVVGAEARSINPCRLTGRKSWVVHTLPRALSPGVGAVVHQRARRQMQHQTLAVPGVAVVHKEGQLPSKPHRRFNFACEDMRLRHVSYS